MNKYRQWLLSLWHHNLVVQVKCTQVEAPRSWCFLQPQMKSKDEFRKVSHQRCQCAECLPDLWYLDLFGVSWCCIWSSAHHEEHRWFEQVDFHKVYRKDGSAMTHGQPAEIMCICDPTLPGRKKTNWIQQVLKWYGMVVYHNYNGESPMSYVATRFDVKSKKSTSQC